MLYVLTILTMLAGQAQEASKQPVPKLQDTGIRQPDDAEVATPAKGDIGQYFGDDQYPPEAIRAGEQGRVVTRLTIDAAGTVTGCDVRSSSGSASLDATTCRISLELVKFVPALDRAGKPVPSHFMLPVRWMLPSEANVTPVILDMHDPNHPKCITQIGSAIRQLLDAQCRGVVGGLAKIGVDPNNAGRISMPRDGLQLAPE